MFHEGVNFFTFAGIGCRVKDIFCLAGPACGIGVSFRPNMGFHAGRPARPSSKEFDDLKASVNW